MSQRLLFGACASVVLFLAATADAGTITYLVDLDGLSQSPPNASPGTGLASLVYDDAAHTMAVHIEFSDLIAGTTAAHIHATTALPFLGTAGVATTVPTFPGFPPGVTSGTYDTVLDLTSSVSFNPAFVTASGGTLAGAESALAAALAGNRAYLNLHTAAFPGGEIRGFFRSTVVPVPAALPLGSAMLGLLLAGRWLRRRS